MIACLRGYLVSIKVEGLDLEPPHIKLCRLAPTPPPPQPAINASYIGTTGKLSKMNEVVQLKQTCHQNLSLFKDDLCSSILYSIDGSIL